MDLALEITFLLLGFVFLAKGSDWLVAGGSTLADRLGVRPLIVGLTVVAWGTSAPEVVVSGLGAVSGEPMVAMGNVLGSNVANIGLVLGVSAMILPKVLHRALPLREALWLLASVLLFWLVIRDLELSRSDGAILLGALIVYNFQLLWEARQLSVGSEPDELHEGAGWLERNPLSATLLGGATIAMAAVLTMEGAMPLAERFNLSKLVISLTVVAVGTSLPELAAGVAGALKGHSDISLGNVVGSNVFNVLGVTGIVALIHPFGGTDAAESVREGLRDNLDIDFPVVLGFSVAALFLTAMGGEKGGRLKGFLLLGSWVGYTVYLIATGEALEPLD